MLLIYGFPGYFSIFATYFPEKNSVQDTERAVIEPTPGPIQNIFTLFRP